MTPGQSFIKKLLMGHGKGKSCSSYTEPPPRIFDDFEDYNLGPLGGQGDWLDLTPGMTVSTVRYERKQGLVCATGANPLSYKPTPILADSYVRCMIKHTGPMTGFPTHPSQGYSINDSLDLLIGFIAIYGETCRYRSNGSWFTLKSGLVTDTWYKLWVYWQSSPARVKYRIDDEADTGWLTRGEAASVNPCTQITLSAEWWVVGMSSCFDYIH